jgi:hypothetical protein
MESVLTAAKNIFRKLFDQSRSNAKSWLLRLLRSAIWKADEWIHAQELKMREDRAKPESLAAVDPANSAAREGVHKARAARPRPPRMKYVAGQFVRNGA